MAKVGFFMGEETQERMSILLTRALVLLSFAAHLTMALLAGIRRRRDSGLRRFLVWFAYYVTEIGTPMALGLVFLDTATADSEQKMFALWAPFLLLHLGHPDNITSYTLENKGLTPPHIFGPVLAIGGAIYGSYKQRFMHDDGALRAAFFIMLFFGSYKYVERVFALHRASFANIRRTNEGKELRRISIEDKGRRSKRDNDDGPSGHRLLSGSSVGQRNLLHECSTPRARGTLEKVVSFFAGPGKKMMDVKDELLEAMCAHVLLESGTTAGRRPKGTR